MSSKKLFFSSLWQSIHCLCSVYTPVDQDTKDAARCYFYSLSKILPNYNLRSLMQEFISENDITPYLISGPKLLEWSYNMRCYIFNRVNNKFTSDKTTILTQYRGADPKVIGKIPLSENICGDNFDSNIPFSVVLQKYDPKNITKDVWGPPSWNLIHSIAINMPQEIPDNLAISIKAMLSCLVYLLPCSWCRKHLRDNLGEDSFDINPYLFNRDSLFIWTYRLHANVSKWLKKPQIELSEAIKLYS